MSLKVLRVIDRRNLLFGKYKYQVRTGRIPGGAAQVRKWMQEKWGHSRMCIETDLGNGARSLEFQDNPRWKEVRKSRFQSPLMYIRSDEDAVMFSLFWASKC